jgi:hypothetical protein
LDQISMSKPFEREEFLLKRRAEEQKKQGVFQPMTWIGRFLVPITGVIGFGTTVWRGSLYGAYLSAPEASERRLPCVMNIKGHFKQLSSEDCALWSNLTKVSVTCVAMVAVLFLVDQYLARRRRRLPINPR